MMVRPPGFSICLVYPILGAEEAANMETPMGKGKKPQEKHSLSSQMTRKSKY